MRWYFVHGMDGYLTMRQARRMVEANEFDENDIVVDVGSGFGGFLVELSNQVAFKNPLIGIELVDGLVEFTKNRLSKEGIKNIRIIKGSALELNKLIDKATIINVGWIIKHIDDDEVITFLKAAFDVLEPGGKLFIFEFAPKTMSKMARRAFHALKLRTNEEIASILESIGFEGIKQNNYARYWIPVGKLSLTAIKP